MRILVRYKSFIIVFLVILLSRFYFIFNSLGLDYDIWRMAYSGKTLWEEHIYNVSRFPGYPFSELLFSLLYHFPYWVINLTSLFFTVGASYIFFLILKKIESRNALLLSLSFSFIPIIFINSTVSMDYNISLFFILLVTYFIINRNFLLAAIFFGLVVCSRFNNILFLLPFVYLVYALSFKNKKQAVRFAFYSCLFSVLFFLPVIIRYKGMFMYHYGTDPVSIKSFVSLGTLHIFGLLGCLALFVIFIQKVLFQWKLFQKRISSLRQNEIFIFCLLFIALNFLFFLRFPLESGYLIPVMPFFLMILSMLFDAKMLKILSFSFILSPFLFYINAKDFQIKGSAFVNEEMENKQLDSTKKLISKINSLPHNSVVYVANIYEHLILIKGMDGFPNPNIFRLLSVEELDKIKNNGVPFYYTEDAINLLNSDFQNYGTPIFHQELEDK